MMGLRCRLCVNASFFFSKGMCSARPAVSCPLGLPWSLAGACTATSHRLQARTPLRAGAKSCPDTPQHTQTAAQLCTADPSLAVNAITIAGKGSAGAPLEPLPSPIPPSPSRPSTTLVPPPPPSGTQTSTHLLLLLWRLLHPGAGHSAVRAGLDALSAQEIRNVGCRAREGGVEQRRGRWVRSKGVKRQHCAHLCPQTCPLWRDPHPSHQYSITEAITPHYSNTTPVTAHTCVQSCPT